MAILQVGPAAPDFQWLSDLLILDTISDVTTETGTTFSYKNSFGHNVAVTGAGFTYSAGKPTDGTISSVVVTDNSSAVLMTIGQISAPLKDFAARLLGGDSFGATESLFGTLNQLIGTDESDTLGGYSRGDDTVDGKGSNDFVAGDQGRDEIHGGDAWDILSYHLTYWDIDGTKGIKLQAKKGTVKDPWGDKDKISGFESYRGTKFKDKMIGSSLEEEFAGLKGSDVIDGKGGFDRADYSHDADPFLPKIGKKGIKADLTKGEITDGYGNVDSVKNIEGVRGTSRKDVFVGDKHDNVFEGLAGKDSFRGGKGFDDVDFGANDYSGGLNGVHVDLGKSKNQIIDDGFGNKETVKSIENIRGTMFDDKIVGDSKENTLDGREGNDILIGGRGNDHLNGGKGNDIITGGKTGDDFNFFDLGAANADTITDFVSGEDQIWLDPVVFVGLAGGELSTEAFLSGAGATAATNGVQRVIYDTTTGNLYFDEDGSGGAAPELFATLKNAPQILASDFEVFVWG